MALPPIWMLDTFSKNRVPYSKHLILMFCLYCPKSQMTCRKAFLSCLTLRISIRNTILCSNGRTIATDWKLNLKTNLALTSSLFFLNCLTFLNLNFLIFKILARAVVRIKWDPRDETDYALCFLHLHILFLPHPLCTFSTSHTHNTRLHKPSVVSFLYLSSEPGMLFWMETPYLINFLFVIICLPSKNFKREKKFPHIIATYKYFSLLCVCVFFFLVYCVLNNKATTYLCVGV